MLRRKAFLLVLQLFVFTMLASAQKTDTISFGMNSRYSFYTTEKTGEMIIHIPSRYQSSWLSVKLKADGRELNSWKGTSGGRLLTVEFPLDMNPGTYKITGEIRSASSTLYRATSELIILPFRHNEVKTDRLTGGLVTGNRIMFPFGFYCYSPVQPELPEQEVVKGFNMISPYQKIVPETLKDRKAYMDRCAMLGMRVHYNLLSVSGGGGVSSQIEGISDEEKRSRLISEIKEFMDHPALLAWYIADEPNGFRIPPGKLEEIYKTIKSVDPWHPVTVVFMAPFMSSRRYANGLDIVMADPYPIPNGSPAQVGTVTRQLVTEFRGKRPVWIVPQAFGGGEWWGREPTIQEIRNMTYLAIVNGATGIQYFIRHGLNSFPKSTAAWNECGRMAIEIAEITPWLLSGDEAHLVSSASDNISVASRMNNGRLLIIAVNKVNAPQKCDIRISGIKDKRARVLFENRTITLSSGTISDYLPALGSQVYLIDITPLKEDIRPYRGNLTSDPGFEDLSSPGIPAATYAWNEGDRGATFFTDTREYFEGSHSLRLVTPKEKRGTRLRFFPVNVQKGKTYIITVMAKTDTTLNYGRDKPCFELGLGDYGKKKFCPANEWRQFVTSVTIPSDTIPSPRVNAVLRMPGKGTAWFDMIQVFEAVDIYRSVNPNLRKLGETDQN